MYLYQDSLTSDFCSLQFCVLLTLVLGYLWFGLTHVFIHYIYLRTLSQLLC